MSGIAGYLDCFAVMQTAYTCISCLSFALWIYCLYAPAADCFLLPSSADVSSQGVNPFPLFGINAGRLRTCLNASGPVVGIETSCYVLIGDADKCIT
ncbi:hypothetical protein D5086_002683 [Populus alba]|uniref:Uncharacterized protein n=1 Tax=Populus alba TaxID=43335 RepID=A0ACC4D280_POPAL